MEDQWKLGRVTYYSNVLSSAFPHLDCNYWFCFGHFSFLPGLCLEMASARAGTKEGAGMDQPVVRLA